MHSLQLRRKLPPLLAPPVLPLPLRRKLAPLVAPPLVAPPLVAPPLRRKLPPLLAPPLLAQQDRGIVRKKSPRPARRRSRAASSRTWRHRRVRRGTGA